MYIGDINQSISMFDKDEIVYFHDGKSWKRGKVKFKMSGPGNRWAIIALDKRGLPSPIELQNIRKIRPVNTVLKNWISISKNLPPMDKEILFKAPGKFTKCKYDDLDFSPTHWVDAHSDLVEKIEKKLLG